MEIDGLGRGQRQFLAGVPIFSGCGEAALDDLVAAARPLALAAGSRLFAEGDPGDFLAVVRHGMLEISFDHGSTPAGIATQGDVIGELAVVAASARSATVGAVRDSELLCIGRDAFQVLLERHHLLALAVSRNLAGRMQVGRGLSRRRQGPSVFGLVALDATCPLEALLRAFVDGLGAAGRTDVVGPGTAPARDLVVRIASNDAAGRVTVLAAPADAPDEWREVCGRSSDRVLAVLGPAPAARLGEGGSFPGWGSVSTITDVVLLDAPDDRARSTAVAARIAPRRLHHVRTPHLDDDTARLSRRVSGAALGLVLSGGGARGFAHIGVLAELAELGFTVDRFGGCSMGALIAAMAARGCSPDEIRAGCRAEFVARSPLNDYTVPRVALIRGRKAEAMLGRLLGHGVIEQLPVPFFAISTDLTSGEAVVHRTGSLLHAVGVSTSLPGLIPPTLADGRVLVDGGLVNNLPVDVMAADGEGPIIAVDVSGEPFRRRRGRRARPSIVETLAGATVAGGRARADANRALADCVLLPDTGGIGLLDFRRLDEAVEAGRRAVQEAAARGDLDALRRPPVLRPGA